MRDASSLAVAATVAAGKRAAVCASLGPALAAGDSPTGGGVAAAEWGGGLGMRDGLPEAVGSIRQ